MIYLNEKEIFESVTFEEVMDTIEEAFRIYEKKDFEMPDRIHAEYNNKTLLYMPCFLKDIFGTKILTVFPENSKKGKAVIDGLMLLNDYETGEPVCLMDGKTLTVLRTGAVGGIGIRNTTNEDVKSLGLIGTGVQGFYQVLFACKARNIEKVYIFDIFKEKAEEFKERLEKKLPNINIKVCDTVKEMLENSEVVVTTTTAKNPVLPDNEELLRGKHFVGIGSYKPDMREYPDSLFRVVDKVLVDTDFGKEESGDLAKPIENGLIKEEEIQSFGAYLISDEDKSAVLEGTTFFKSVGMALFDITVSQLIYNRAKEKGVGQEIEL